jgi:hypothetical protein
MLAEKIALIAGNKLSRILTSVHIAGKNCKKDVDLHKALNFYTKVLINFITST